MRDSESTLGISTSYLEIVVLYSYITLLGFLEFSVVNCSLFVAFLYLASERYKPTAQSRLQSKLNFRDSPHLVKSRS